MIERTIVLVVEDEPLLRMSVADMVENAGFTAVEAANATEAIRILETRSDVRIVLSDIHMPPGIDGLKFAALVRDRWPPVHIVLVSGNVEPPRDQLPLHTQFFPKPYDERKIVAALKSLAA